MAFRTTEPMISGPMFFLPPSVGKTGGRDCPLFAAFNLYTGDAAKSGG
ncbi:hypothetical protein [Rhizobium lentis]|nr:hypothetical protein [Rhizobium lentis]MBX4989370.1 hypothetical protein [Rhizobium lentis]